MSIDTLPETRSNTRSTPCIVLGAAATALGLGFLWRPASVLLRSLSPDGTFEASTVMLLDRLGPLMLVAGLLLLACGFASRLRFALAGAATAVVPTGSAVATARWLAPGCAVFACLLRLGVATASDVGLGDDGARVVWLEEWLRDPHAVWTGLWLPAHLYLHAMFHAVIRDAVWAGIALSAVAASGAVWILTHVTERLWGRAEALAAGLATSILPVSLAYGSTPDVNPVFAFFVVAAVAAVSKAARGNGSRWLVIGWLCLVTATWMRFDSLPLVPLVALILWPRRWTALLFTLAGIAPLVGWNIVNAYLARNTDGGPLGVMARDPMLGGSPIALVFGFLGAIWQSATLPGILLGLAGMWRAWRARTGRRWMLPLWGHLAALAGGVLLLAAGLQPRYFILIGTLAAFYAAVGLGGIVTRDRGIGLAAGVGALALIALTPSFNPDGHDLWIRRNTDLRALVDEVAAKSEGRDIVWVSEESGYFYACRKRPPQAKYHALPRADSDPAKVLEELRNAPSAVAVVQQADLPQERWAKLIELAGSQWSAEPLFDRGEYRVYVLRSARPPG